MRYNHFNMGGIFHNYFHNKKKVRDNPDFNTKVLLNYDPIIYSNPVDDKYNIKDL